MIKKIPGNLEYRIGLDKIIFDYCGNIINLPEIDGKFKIILFGKERLVDLEWLSLFAWYECGDIVNLHKHLDKIVFKDINNTILRIRCGKIMTFTEPIYYNDEFRYIPNYPRYAINPNGVLLDTHTNTLVKDIKPDDKGYLTCYIRVPDRNSNRTIKLHRLIALAWIPNNCFLTRALINHKDGMTANNDISNLEWCDASENVQHALRTGLNSTEIKTKVRHVVSGKVDIFNSISEMNRTLGLGIGNSTVSFTSKLPGYLWNKCYEIKLFDDVTPWYYETVELDDFKIGKSIFTITVLDRETGQLRKFNRLKTLAKAYNLSYKFEKIENFLVRFKEKVPYCDVTYVRNNIIGPYWVMDSVTNTLHVFSSLLEVSKFTGRSKAELQVDLSCGFKYIYDKRWTIRTDSNKYDKVIYIDKPKQSIAVQIVKIATGEITQAKSLKDAVKQTGINYKTISKSLKKGISTKGYSFRALEL